MVFGFQRYLHPVSVLLYRNGVLPVRTALRYTTSGQTTTSDHPARLGQADRQRHDLPSFTQDHSQRSQVSQVRTVMLLL